MRIVCEIDQLLRPDRTEENLNELLWLHANRSAKLLKNFYAQISTSDALLLIDRIKEQCGVEMTYPELIEFLNCFPETRVKIARHGVGDSEAFESVMYALSVFLVGVPYQENEQLHKIMQEQLGMVFSIAAVRDINPDADSIDSLSTRAMHLQILRAAKTCEISQEQLDRLNAHAQVIKNIGVSPFDVGVIRNKGKRISSEDAQSKIVFEIDSLSKKVASKELPKHGDTLAERVAKGPQEVPDHYDAVMRTGRLIDKCTGPFYDFKEEKNDGKKE